MRILIFSVAATLALTAAGVALAGSTDTSAAAAAAASEPMVQSPVPGPEHTDTGNATQVSAKTGEKLICHHPVHEGTTLPQEVCLTQRDWDRIRMREQKNVNDWQMHGYQAAVH